MLDHFASDDAALDLYRQSLHQSLGKSQLFEFDFSSLDHLNHPLWTVALIGEDGALSDGFGYGPNQMAAQTSAWGETIEWFHTREALRHTPRQFATFAQMQTRAQTVDPVSLNLSAGSDYDANSTVLEWMEVRSYPQNEPVWVPIEFVAPRYADIESEADKSRFLAVPITNGSGAGPSFEHAVAHGILELLQRDGNSAQYRALDRGIVIELDAVQNPQTRALLDDLHNRGIEVMAKLACTDFGMTNLYVVGHERNPDDALQPISLSGCGEAVHPDREVALGKALREFCSARARKAFNHGPLSKVRAIAPSGYLESFRPSSMRSEDDRALREMRGWMNLNPSQWMEMLHPIFARNKTVKFSQLPTTAIENSAQLLAFLVERLAQDGLQVLVADFSPPNSDLRVVKVVIPGLEVETMTYERIGARNLRRLLQQNSPLVGVDNAPPDAKAIRLTAEQQAEFGDAWYSPRAKEAIIGALYPLYREPGRHVLGFLDEQL